MNDRASRESAFDLACLKKVEMLTAPGNQEKLIAKIQLKQQKLKLKMERDKARREEAKRLKEATAAGL